MNLDLADSLMAIFGYKRVVEEALPIDESEEALIDALVYERTKTLPSTPINSDACPGELSLEERMF